MIGASVGSVGIAPWNLTPTDIHRRITLRCLLPSSLPFTTILLDSIEATVNPSSHISPEDPGQIEDFLLSPGFLHRLRLRFYGNSWNDGLMWNWNNWLEWMVFESCSYPWQILKCNRMWNCSVCRDLVQKCQKCQKNIWKLKLSKITLQRKVHVELILIETAAKRVEFILFNNSYNLKSIKSIYVYFCSLR